jgi:membrane fusion protein, epimerase transport system
MRNEGPTISLTQAFRCGAALASGGSAAKQLLLLIDVHIGPQDVQTVHKLEQHGRGGSGTHTNANVLLTAHRMRATPQVAGGVSYVGADRPIDLAARAPYYLAHIRMSAQALQDASDLAGQCLTLSPEMQAEVFMATRERTALRYLLDPILDGVRRGIQEQ